MIFFLVAKVNILHSLVKEPCAVGSDFVHYQVVSSWPLFYYSLFRYSFKLLFYLYVCNLNIYIIYSNICCIKYIGSNNVVYTFYYIFIFVCYY